MSRTVIVLAWAASIGLACVSASAADPAPASRPAFPGAEGFGAAAVGGRGGRVLKVTSLEADGPGSLQWACAQKGPRIVVFDVSGVIPVRNGSLKVGDGHITIAGQTAPGAGITVEGMLSCRGGTEGFTDVVVRFVRFRPKKEGTGDHAVLFTDTRRFILDHVSGSWGMDENFGLSTCGDFTVQWCAIEESDWPGPLSEYRVGDGPWYRGGGNHPHSFGMIMGYVPNGNATLHHNLFAHHNRRTPLCGIEPLDHRNNVIYDVKEGIMFHPPRFNKDRPDKPFRANIVGDTFKEGPSCPKITEGKNLPDKVGGGRWMVAESPGEIYAAGNWFGTVGKVADVWTEQIPAVSMGKSSKAEKPWPCPPVTTQPAEQAYRLVLAHVGCLPRDAVGRRTIDDTRNATGEWGRHDPPGGLMAGLAPGKAPADADGDGMPDDWEKAHGLNPANPADATKLVPAGASEADRHRGYTYIEFYANDLADRLVAEAMKQAKED
jgi:pectate lyase